QPRAQATPPGGAGDGHVLDFPLIPSNVAADEKTCDHLIFLDYQRNQPGWGAGRKQAGVGLLVPVRRRRRVAGNLHHARHVFAACGAHPDHDFPLEKISASERRVYIVVSASAETGSPASNLRSPMRAMTSLPGRAEGWTRVFPCAEEASSIRAASPIITQSRAPLLRCRANSSCESSSWFVASAEPPDT